MTRMRNNVRDDLKAPDDSGEVPKPDRVVGISILNHEFRLSTQWKENQPGGQTPLLPPPQQKGE